MNFFNKLLLLFILLTNFVYVICPPTMNNIKLCRMHINAAFDKKLSSLEKFLHAFLNINTESYKGMRAYTEVVQNYCLDLLTTAMEMDKPYLKNPQEFCDIEFPNEEEKCTQAIADMGCVPSISGVDCFQIVYFNWKFIPEEIVQSRSLETKHLSNKDLLDAISKGLGDRDLSDNGVMEELSDERLLVDFFNEQRELYGYPKRHHRGRPLRKTKIIRRNCNIEPGFRDFSDKTLLEEFFEENPLYYNIMEDFGPPVEVFGIDSLRQNKNALGYFRHLVKPIRNMEDALYKARSRKYGIFEVSFGKLCQELTRRQSIRTKNTFKNDYMNYLHDTIKKCDGTKFNDPTKFCTQFISEPRNIILLLS